MPEFGFINCDKPPGMTSRDVVNVVQRRANGLKVGHAGTLDPLAQGVLVLGVGPAVRLVPYVQQQRKHYDATFRLGQSSVSGDLEGEVQTHADLPIPSLDQLRDAASRLTGNIEQIPPAHSAIWIDGQRAYKRVRAGEQVEMPTRTVTVHSLEITRYEYPEMGLDIVCGSGTYIRTLGIDLATLTGSTAVMSRLKRVAVGEFDCSESVSIQRLREEPIAELLISPTVGVSQLAKLIVDDQQSVRLGHGLDVDGDVDGDVAGVVAGVVAGQAAIEEGSEAAAVTADGRLRAIVRRKRDAWFPYRVFPVD